MGRWNNAISCMGDSLTHNATLMIPSEELWPAQLQNSLVALGKSLVVRNFGKSGGTTTQMLARFAAMTQFGVPKIGIIWGGTNDVSDTQAKLEAMIIALVAAGCTRNIIVGNHLLNYSAGGDITAGVPVDDTACTYAAIIALQKAAATAQGAVYCNLYDFLKARITGGSDVAGSFSWHVADSNIHLNSYGNGLVSNCILATIQTQNWDDIL